jgi:AcrR family transcriptional regulator
MIFMDASKRTIVSAGRALLVRDGALGFSMRKVAAAAGMSLGNLQYHYKTRDDLIEGMLDGFLDDYSNGLTQIEPSKNPGPGELASLIQLILEEESGEDELSFLRALVILSDERRMSKKLEEYFSGMYDLFRLGLAKVCQADAASSGAHQAASLLLPFVQGFSLVRTSLKPDIPDLSRMLSEQIWVLLKKA